MSKFPDISEWYTEERAVQEEVAWILTEGWKNNLKNLLPPMAKYGVKSAWEFGCGSGIMGVHFPPEIAYCGIDANPYFIRMANARRDRNALQHRDFKQCDIREFNGLRRDLAVCFSVLKHFSLEEWPKILAKILSHSRYGAFLVQVIDDPAGQSFDNGKEYHHIHVGEKDLQAAIASAGAVERERVVQSSWTVEGRGLMNDVLVWTENKGERQ